MADSPRSLSALYGLSAHFTAHRVHRSQDNSSLRLVSSIQYQDRLNSLCNFSSGISTLRINSWRIRNSEEIAHTGGKVTFDVEVDTDGRVSYSVGWSHSNPTPAGIFAVYAIPPGITVGDIRIQGIGVPWNAPPVPGAYPVFISTDSEGMYGSKCPSCDGYWRARFGSFCCPYCAERVMERHLFLTEGQRRFVAVYCDRLNVVLRTPTPGKHVIDMDAVVDAVGSGHPRPPFYYTEERQQNLFTCVACATKTDVLGTFAYCSGCSTRNDESELTIVLARVRARIGAGEAPEACAKDAVAAFDPIADQYAAQLVRRVPLTPARRALVGRGPYHNLARVIDGFRQVFGIDMTMGMAADDIAFATLMFHRRHVYEHKAGEADEKYIRDSGDSVRLKQALRETKESAHRTATVVSKLVSNLHSGFHEIFPPDEAAIERYQKSKRRMAP